MIDDGAELLAESAAYYEQYPERWITGILAADENRKSVMLQSQEAVCFCLSGVVNRFAYGPVGAMFIDKFRYTDRARQDAFRTLNNLLGARRHTTVSFNDNVARNVQEVIAVLRQAERQLRSQLAVQRHVSGL